MEEVNSQGDFGPNPYQEDPEIYMKIGAELGCDEVPNQQINDLPWKHVLAMDARAAARPFIEDVYEEVYDRGLEEDQLPPVVGGDKIFGKPGDNSGLILNYAGDEYLSQNKIHGNIPALGAAAAYLGGIMSDMRETQETFAQAADVSTSALRERHQGLSDELAKNSDL